MFIVEEFAALSERLIHTNSRRPKASTDDDLFRGPSVPTALRQGTSRHQHKWDRIVRDPWHGFDSAAKRIEQNYDWRRFGEVQVSFHVVFYYSSVNTVPASIKNGVHHHSR